MNVDDLSPGMHVTVLRWKPREVPIGDAGSPSWMTGSVTMRTVQDQSYVGDPLLVKAIQLPFVVVQRLTRHKPQPHDTFKLDTRRVDLVKLNPSYVSALVNDET